MRLSFALVLSLFLGVSGRAADEPAIREAKRAALRAKLEAIVIPDLLWKEVTMRTALVELRSAIHAADPEPEVKRKGVNIALRLDGNEVSNRRISLQMKAPTAMAVLEELARLSSCRIVVEPYAVLLLPEAGRVAVQPKDITLTLTEAPSLLLAETKAQGLVDPFDEEYSTSREAHGLRKTPAKYRNIPLYDLPGPGYRQQAGEDQSPE